MKTLHLPLRPVAILLLALAACTHHPGASADYPVYGGNKENNRYSPLTQINIDNVKSLQLAWTYNSNAATASNIPPPARRAREIQCQPIVVDGILYGTSSTLKLFALDAATGKQRWQFDPFKNKRPRINQCRGITWYAGDDSGGNSSGNAARLFYAAGSNLYAIDAHTGTPVTTFGDSGHISLYTGLDLNHPVEGLYVTATSPGIVYKNTLIIGSAVSESGDAAPGYLRGFDARTGKLVWTFHTIPQPGEPGYDTWPKDAYKFMGGVNNWSGLSLDEKRGTVYLGTGSPSSDFYGGDRPGDNLYSDCILALDATTGKLRWYFQTIHHDLWDRDIPCPPNLTTIDYKGKKTDVLVQATKDGLVYVLDRDNGTSLFPIEERPVPTTGLPGEHPAITQRYPQKPAPFAHQTITDTDLTNISPEAHAFVKKIYDGTTNAANEHNAANRSRTANPQSGKFLPPDTLGTLLVGYSGGAEWGGNAIDPNGILYQNGNDAPWLVRMISKQERQRLASNAPTAESLYLTNCATCHGANRKGNGHEIPDLTTVAQRLEPADIAYILSHGQNRMPSFPQLTEPQRYTIIKYLIGNPTNNTPQNDQRVAAEHRDPTHTKPANPNAANPNTAAAANFPYSPPYTSRTWDKLTDSDGYPGIKPPWGTLNAIDLRTGDYRWRVPLGEFPELKNKGIPPTGMESYGGPLVTAGGLLFIAGTRDEMLRAFDTRTGNIVWQYHLPNAGFATPITYEVDGTQYIVIAAGGGRGLPTSGNYLAFKLPATK